MVCSCCCGTWGPGVCCGSRGNDSHRDRKGDGDQGHIDFSMIMLHEAGR